MARGGGGMHARGVHGWWGMHAQGECVPRGSVCVPGGRAWPGGMPAWGACMACMPPSLIL